jgi:hypothetical protein
VAFAYPHARRDIPRLPLAIAKLLRSG